MMKMIAPKTHRIMDYFVVLAYLVAPSLLDFSERASVTMYVLAVMHLGLTIMTRPPIGHMDMLSPKIHALVETTLPVLLLALPWLAGFSADDSGRNFFIASGIFVAATRLMTDYGTDEHRVHRAATL